MQDLWISLAVQVPLVAAFMWFALEMLKRFDEALARRDEALTNVAERMGELNTTLKVHDERLGHVDERLGRLVAMREGSHASKG